MIITEILARNRRMYENESALVEIEPERNRRKEFTWKQFDDQSSQIAQALISYGVIKNDRVVQLMMNCIEWLPAYFGILRTGALSVPLNFRFDAKTIEKCISTAEAKVLIFGEEFIDRINTIKTQLDRYVKTYIFVGPEEMRPEYSLSYYDILNSFLSQISVCPLEKVLGSNCIRYQIRLVKSAVYLVSL